MTILHLHDSNATIPVPNESFFQCESWPFETTDSSQNTVLRRVCRYSIQSVFCLKRAALWCLSTFKNNNSVTCLFYSTKIIRILSSVWCIKALLCCAAVIKCENNARARRRFSRFGGNSIDQLATARRKLVITCRETVSSLSSI